MLNENEKYTHHLACCRFQLPNCGATLSQAAAVLECCSFLPCCLPSPDGKVLGQITRESLMAFSLSLNKSARCFLKLSIPCFILSAVTEICALHILIRFSLTLRYILMTTCTALDIMLCKIKRTATAMLCKSTHLKYDVICNYYNIIHKWITKVLGHRKCFQTEVSSVADHFYLRLEVKDLHINVFLWHIKVIISEHQNLTPYTCKSIV